MPCQASGSNADLIYAEEDSWGTFQTSAAKWKGLRSTPGESLQSEINRFQSNELSRHRSVLNTAGGNIRAGGGVPFELAPEGFLLLFKHLLWGTVETTGSVGSWCHILKAGSTDPGGLSIEKRFNDITKYLRYWGAKIDSLNLTFPQEGYITGNFNFLAKGEISDENAAADYPGGTYGSSGVSISPAASFSTDEPFVGYSSVIQEGNPLVNITKITQASLTISNNLNPDGFVMSSRYRECITPGKRNVTGNVTMFFVNMDQYNKFLNETRTALRFFFQRGTKSFDIFMPRVEFTGESPKINDEGGLTLTIPFRALHDYNEGTDVKVTIRSTETFD